MVRLVTQYNNMRGPEPFARGTGWDGADGPWVFHYISDRDMQYSLATYVKLGENRCSIRDWLSGTDHLNSFRLELVYE